MVSFLEKIKFLKQMVKQKYRTLFKAKLKVPKNVTH